MGLQTQRRTSDARHAGSSRGLRRVTSAAAALAALASWLPTTGCVSPVELQLRREVSELRDTLRKKDDELGAKSATIDQLHRQLAVARSISEDDLKQIFYPEKLVIDPLSGGADYDSKPGDDGVTVYLQPVDRYGDVVKVPGDITIELYDLAAPPERKLIGEYHVPVDQVAKLWRGKLLAQHFAIKCPWAGRIPQNPELTIRAIFVDYLTKRVVSAQTTCKLKRPPGDTAPAQTK